MATQKHLRPTQFEIRDSRRGEVDFAPANRQLYKKMIRLHDKAGQPFTVDTRYVDGTVHKRLTLKKDTTVLGRPQ